MLVGHKIVIVYVIMVFKGWLLTTRASALHLNPLLLPRPLSLCSPSGHCRRMLLRNTEGWGKSEWGEVEVLLKRSQCLPDILQALCHIFNCSLQIGVAPDQLKWTKDNKDHNILLNKLQAHDAIGTERNWVKSYVLIRKQCFFSNLERNSSYSHIQCGVPQGSILGFSFISYILQRFAFGNKRSAFHFICQPYQYFSYR